MTEEQCSSEGENVSQMRPDLLFSIKKSKNARYQEEHDLEEEHLGFYCHACGWRNLSLPLSGIDEGLDSSCPECGAEVENLLTTHIDHIQRIYDQRDDAVVGFMPLSDMRQNFNYPNDRLDEAINYLLTHDEAFVVFEDGEPYINITR